MRTRPRVLGLWCVVLSCVIARPAWGQQTGVVVTLRPATANLAVNQTQRFTATVTGSENPAVTWSVDGGLGNGTIVSVDGDGLYTAPASVPNPPTVTVRATSVADPTRSGAASVTVRVLRLFAPENVRVFAEMNPDRRSFTDYIFWNAPFWDRPSADSSFYVHPPDTSGWLPKGSTTPPEDLSTPSSGGRYTGGIDRTFQFTATESGVVGEGAPNRPSLRIRCEVVGGREELKGQIDIGQGYVAGTPKKVILNPGRVDLGFTVSFSADRVDSNAVFKVGMEAFEGFHIFRGTCPVCGDESDLSNIGEVSREEAFRRETFDSLYFAAMLPALRASGVYTLPEAVPGLGSTIDIRGVHPKGVLGPDEYIWVDRNAFNGFTYHYLVTTFDKGYNVGGTSQGISKFDNCQVVVGENCPCSSELVSVSTQVEPGGELNEIYAVPNPYRSGTSQNTTAYYHNFPDNKMRFVNVPSQCELKIYTPAGDLVWEASQTDGSGVIEWDTRNRGSELVASGVYIYRVEGKSGEWMFGRIVIIR